MKELRDPTLRLAFELGLMPLEMAIATDPERAPTRDGKPVQYVMVFAGPVDSLPKKDPSRG